MVTKRKVSKAKKSIGTKSAADVQAPASAPAVDVRKPSVSGRVAARPEVPRAAGVSAGQSNVAARPEVPRATGVSAGQSNVAAQFGEPDVDGATPRTNAERSERPRPRKRHVRWPWIVVGVLLAIVVAVAAIFSWDRWLRYDDAAEMQGEWQVHDATSTVVIDSQTIKLTDDVAYTYTIDPFAKTITYTFGDLSGSGRYRFSLDRTQLIIMDGTDYSWFSTMSDDIGWMLDQALCAIQGTTPALPSGEGVTALDRLSHETAAAPTSVVGTSGTTGEEATGDAAAADEQVSADNSATDATNADTATNDAA